MAPENVPSVRIGVAPKDSVSSTVAEKEPAPVLKTSTTYWIVPAIEIVAPVSVPRAGLNCGNAIVCLLGPTASEKGTVSIRLARAEPAAHNSDAAVSQGMCNIGFISILHV